VAERILRNDDSGSETGSRASEARLQEVVPVGRRGAPLRVLGIGLAIVVVIGTLVAKPWSAAEQTAPGGAAASLRSAVESLRAASPSQTPTIANVGSLPTIQPDRWADISASLRLTNADGIVLVARYPPSLFYDFEPVTPSATPIPEPPRDDGTSNTVHATGSLGNPLAIGLTRPDDAEIPIVVGWQFRDWADQRRLPITHPVGDVDRLLYIGLWLPSGEKNIREVSQRPLEWQAGTYRFDITSHGQTRYLFLILDP